MTAAGEEARPVRTPSWLFDPFHYLAGAPALGVGLVAILAAGALGSASRSHFDGVLDFHTGRPVALWLFLAEGLIDWLALSVALLAGGWLAGRRRFRAIDVFGTQALARAPTLPTAAVALVPGYRAYAERLLSGQLAAPPVAFLAVLVVILLMTVWMVALMYRAYAVACNVRGGRAVASFIAALAVAWVASKMLILQLL